MLTAREIRKRYLDYFGRHAHKIVKSGPLIPEGDPTLLFTNAGMVQFKDFFLGAPNKPYSRATTCQKCLRVSGKHNDLENVGRTARHHTFFEMLGNFSFGDYFKKEAIAWAWEFVTSELGLPKEKLWVTIYKDDDEAAQIWREVAGLPEERIVRMGEKDNFWTMGETGPCGPCSEIYIDQGEDMACGPDCGIGKCDCDRFLEIWNLVFTQYDQQADGSRALLSAPNIDTGMGLERIAAVCQGKRSNFDCDLFQEIIQHAASMANVEYSFSAPDTNEIDTALRVIADHARAAAFLIAEGVLPSNENRGYVLRRLIRRALRFATLMGVTEPFLYKVAAKVADVMGDAYPELQNQQEFIEKAVQAEEKRFALTLQNGLRLLDDEIERLSKEEKTEIPGEVCFKLYDTYGFPLDIITDVVEKRGFTVDAAGYEKLMRDQRERARAHQKSSGLLGQRGAEELKDICGALAEKGARCVFVGYETLEAESEILALLDADAQPVAMLEDGQAGYVATARTPFYAESGGQVADSGQMRSVSGTLMVTGVIRPHADIILHEIRVMSGEIENGQPVKLIVESDERKAIARNHTCTHLLHAVLRRVLGDHVHQAGSLVDAQKLRFDFSHLAALSKEELAEIERGVNLAIMADFPVNVCVMDKERAVERGAMALFSEKYGDQVRVLTIGDENAPESIELCGGTHLDRTGEAGSFYIVSEGGVAAGVRRIEAVTGWNAYNKAINERGQLASAAAVIKVRPEVLLEKIVSLQDEVKKLRKTAEKAAQVDVSPENLAQKAVQCGDVTLLEAQLSGASMKLMRELMDALRGRFSSGAVICLAGEEKGQPALLLHVSKDLHKDFTAPDLIKSLTAICGGGGGGRPDLARAGGCQNDKISAAMDKLKEIVVSKEKRA